MFILQETAKETAKVISTTQGLVGDFNQSKTDHVILKGTTHDAHFFRDTSEKNYRQRPCLSCLQSVALRQLTIS